MTKASEERQGQSRVRRGSGEEEPRRDPASGPGGGLEVSQVGKARIGGCTGRRPAGPGM